MSSKHTVGSLAAMLVLFLTACSQPAAPEPSVEPVEVDTATESVQVEEAPVEEIEVDEGLFDVEITVPGDFYEGMSEDEIAQIAEDGDFKSFSVNPDGSVTWVMSKAVRDAYLVEAKEELKGTIQEMVNESPNVFKEVTYDDDLTEFSVTVDRAAYESDMNAMWASFTLSFSAMFYQMFAGVPSDQQGGVVNFIDESNGEVFDSQVWPIEG